MKIVIIGGGGFVGTNLSLRFLAEGCSVTIYTRSVCFQPIIHPKVDYIFGESFEESVLKQAIEACDAIFLCYSLSYPGMDNPYFDQIIIKEIEGHFKLLRLIPSDSGKTVVYISSGGAIYGDGKGLPLKENHSKNPISYYGSNKLALENYIRNYCTFNSLKYLIFRPSNPFGPWQNFKKPQGIIATLLSNYLNKKNTHIWGDGSIVRDYIYIDDLTEAIYKTVMVGIENEEFNIGAGEGKTVNEVIEVVNEVVENKLCIIFEKGRQTDVKSIILDTQKIRNQINWYSNIGFREGVSKHYEWMREYFKKDCLHS